MVERLSSGQRAMVEFPSSSQSEPGKTIPYLLAETGVAGIESRGKLNSLTYNRFRWRQNACKIEHVEMRQADLDSVLRDKFPLREVPFDRILPGMKWKDKRFQRGSVSIEVWSCRRP